MKKLIDLVEQVRFAELDKIVKLSNAQEESVKKENQSHLSYKY